MDDRARSYGNAAPPRIPPARRALGLRIILALKAVKAVAMFALAIWISVAPLHAARVAEKLATELAAHRHVFKQLAEWLEPRLTSRVLTIAAMVAWLDALVTTLEFVLLWLGKPWGEWIVLAGTGALLPIELVNLERRPGPGRLVVLLVNAAVVLYLLRRRVRARVARSTAEAEPR